MTSAYSLDFVVNAEGGIVIRKVGSEPDRNRDRFDAARGTADVKWRTNDLMAMQRGDA
jgi:antitoxin PrlF